MKFPSFSKSAVTAMTATATTSSSSPASMNSCSNSGYQSRISKLANQIQPRVLVSSRGSGNYGESGKANFYTIDQLPIAFTKGDDDDQRKKLERVDIDLGPNRLAFVVDNVLTPEEADTLAACAEAVLEHNGHSRLAPGIHTPPGMRVNEAAHWYPSQKLASTMLTTIFDRFRGLVPQTLENGLPLYPRLSQKVAQFKYNQGDQFQRHIDGLFPGQGANPEGDGVEEWMGVVSGMSMLFFLNDLETDGLEGGATRLWTANGSRFVDVQPRKGRVLFFRRGSPNAVLHAGLPVTGEVPKYMALINLAYGEQIGTQPLM